MTGTSLVPIRLWKEFRGLSPAWLACLGTMAVVAALDDRVRALGLVAYFLGAVAVGALSVGHEYNSRTLALLLAQPVKRERLFLEKLGVLAAMLLVLGAVAWLVLYDPTVRWDGSSRSARSWWVFVFALPLLCGLFVAPWLTMVCRNALAGMVFAVAIPATVWVASDITSAVTYGGELSATIEARDFAFELFWRGTEIVCVLAAVASWWMFVRLEAIDSRGLEVHLPSWLSSRAGSMAAAPAFARRHAMWLLVKKELRLQQLTFAVSGLYLVGWLGISLFREWFPLHQITLLSASTAFHGGAIALLAGSLPSAEERQLGTLEWQVLLPMAAWKQWAVKAGVALSVAIVLALGLPIVLSFIASSPEIRRELPRLYSPAIALVVLMATAGSLYVSSLSANGLRALLVSLPAVLGVMGFAARWVVGPVYGRNGLSGGLNLVFAPMRRLDNFFGTREIVLSALLALVLIVTYTGLLALLVRFAMVNHRSTERGSARVWKQLSWMAGSLVVGSLLWVALFAPYRQGVDRLLEAGNREWMATRASAAFVIEDIGDTAALDCVIMLFSENRDLPGWDRNFFFVTARRQGRFGFEGLRPGPYSAVALAPGARAIGRLENDLRVNTELRERLRKNATAITLPKGESTSVTLKLTQVP